MTFLPTRAASVAAAVVAAGVLLTACGSSQSAGSTATEAAPEAPAAAEAPGTGDPGQGEGATAASEPSAATQQLREALVGSVPVRYDAADVQGALLDGSDFDATAVDGPVVYWFWAPWCTVCRAEAPDVAAAADKFGDDVTFVGVASRGPVSDMEAFVEQTGVGGFPHIADVDGRIWAQFGVSAQPAFVIVDAEGNGTGWLGALGEPLLDQVGEALAG